MNQKLANKIIEETEGGYDLMSEKFSQTRKYFWQSLEFLADFTKAGDKILDFGCGNGRLMELIGSQGIDYYGTDISEKLLEIARKKYAGKILRFGSGTQHFSKINSDQEKIVFADDFFNAVYSIAVFHHLPSKKYRDDFAKELYRVTKKGGYVIITVWNLWPASICGYNRSSTRGKQKRYIKNIIENWLRKLVGKSRLDWNDCYISFTNNEGKKFQRFHHAFTRNELRRLFSRVGFEIESCEIIGGRNIVLVGKK
jgi:ubiquinone/menaquinone biosynthesis C-methylase UbiE